VEHWYKNPLVIATAGAAVGLLGNIVVAYLNAATSAEADQRKACYDMVHQAIGEDEDKSRTNLRFLQEVGLLSRCGELHLESTLSGSSSAIPVQPPVPAAAPASQATTPSGAQPDGMTVFHGCGMEGDSTLASVRAFNALKNRYATPVPASFDANATLAALLQPGPDATRWDSDHAATLEGWAVKIAEGAVDSADCHALDSAYRPTEIYLAQTPSADDPERVLALVTPRLRAIMAASKVDWSTSALTKAFLNKRVRLDGWLLFDAPHAATGRNTPSSNDHRTALTRATAWELAPVTSIEAAPPASPSPGSDGG